MKQLTHIKQRNYRLTAEPPALWVLCLVCLVPESCVCHARVLRSKIQPVPRRPWASGMPILWGFLRTYQPSLLPQWKLSALIL